MICLHRSASSTRVTFLHFCIKRASAHTPRQVFITASPTSQRDKDDTAGEPTSSWGRLPGAESFKKVKSVFQELLEVARDGAPESAKSKKPELNTSAYYAQPIAKPAQQVSSESRPIMDASGVNNGKYLERVIAEAVAVGDLKEGNSEKDSRPSRDLIEMLLTRTNSFGARDLVNIFEMINELDLGDDSTLLNGLIEALSLKFDELPLSEIMRFGMAVQKAPHGNIHLEMAKNVIPVVFESRYQKELRLNSSQDCQKALVFSCRTNMRLRVCAYIADAAVDFSPYFSPEQAFDVFINAAPNRQLWQDVDSMRTVLVHCIETLSRNVRKMEMWKIRKLLICCKHGAIGTTQLFDCFWELARSWSPLDVELLLRTGFKRNLYMSAQAAEIVTGMILRNSSRRFLEDCFVSAPGLSTAIALHYREQEPNSEGMRRCQRAANALIETDRCTRLLTEDRGSFLRLLTKFGYVGVFPEPLLRQAFSPDFQEECGYDELRELAILERQLLLHYGGDSPHRMLPRTKAVATRLPPNRDHEFEKYFRAALGGSRFCRPRMTTPLGTPFDYAIAMRADDRPISVPQKGNFFEELPPATKVVALLRSNTAGVYSLTGLRKIHISITESQLKAQNLCTAVILRDEFCRLQAQDRVAYLKELLREAYLNGPEYAHRFPSTQADEK